MHKDSIAAGVLGVQESSPRIEVIGPGPDAVRRLIKKGEQQAGAGPGVL